MKQLIKINNTEIESIDQLWKIIQDIQLHDGFKPVQFEFISKKETQCFDGVFTGLTPLGESRVEFDVMYIQGESSDGQDVSNLLNVYFLKNEFYCALLRGFNKIIVSGDEVESLEPMELEK